MKKNIEKYPLTRPRREPKLHEDIVKVMLEKRIVLESKLKRYLGNACSLFPKLNQANF